MQCTAVSFTTAWVYGEGEDGAAETLQGQQRSSAQTVRAAICNKALLYQQMSGPGDELLTR